MSVERRAAGWMARAAWILATLLAAVPLLSIFYQPVGWGPRLCVGALALIAAWSPFNGLLVLAGLGPFAATILVLTRTGSASVVSSGQRANASEMVVTGGRACSAAPTRWADQSKAARIRG